MCVVRMTPAPPGFCRSPAAIDTNANGTVERTEFADFIFHLAVAELKSTQAASLSELED